MFRLPRSERARAALVAAVIAFAHAPSFARPLLDSDEAVYASVAALVNAEGRLYAEGGVDNKFPGIYWTYAIVFGVFGRYSMQAVHALALLVVLATAYVLGHIGRRLGGSHASGLMSALFYGVLTTFYYPKMLAANTELFMMLPLALSVSLSLPSENGRGPRFGWLFVAGALIGVASLYRQLAGLNLALSCLAPLISSKTSLLQRLRAAAAPVLGFVVTFAAVAGVFFLQGTLHDFWFWTVAVTTTRYLPGGWSYRFPWGDLLTMLAIMSLPVVLTVLRARRVFPAIRGLPMAELLVWIWLPLSVLAILVLWRFHPHYIIHVVGPLSVLAGIEAHQRFATSSHRHRRFWTIATTALLALPSLTTFVLALVLEPVAGGFEPARPNYPRVAAYIREHTRRDDRVFVWGAYAALYVLADRLPASRFVGFMRGCPRNARAVPEACWDSGVETWPLLRKDLLHTAPELIIDTAPANWGGFAVFPFQRFPVLREVIEQRYVFERTLEGVHIYRLKSNLL